MAPVNPPQAEPSVASDGDREARFSVSSAPAHATAPLDPDERILHLYHMSPTAGVGTTDYAAINAMSIVALLLGFGSVAAVTSNIMLLIPVAGVICAMLALSQIMHSNGTQTGRSFAAIGLVLSLGIGAAVSGWRLVAFRQASDDQRQIAQQMADIGTEVTQGRLPELYAQLSERFRSRVPEELFASRMAGVSAYEQLGKLTAIRWNEEPMVFQGGDGGEKTATAMAFLTLSKLQEPTREIFVFVRDGNHWVLDDIPQQFPADKKKQQRGGPRPSAGPMP